MSDINPFKLLDQKLEETPPELKEKVMADVSKAKLILEIASLFGDALPVSLNELFINKNKTN
ncbi:hypothetical protein MM239_13135 [Belliella sp. DSM 111904]|uniref:Uncharacterized protein n=1 Tax=Belliella filtrata TaxID=2923435 RepID=A0ABS9V1Q4_9BACT|nr:hypothetical protein [Belliella filtrata]MCH7410345.1 hypothetical protein [Belliella filtrata]